MSAGPLRVLVLGGYGHFGSVIAERIAGIAGVEVIVAGRDGARAEALAQRIGAQSARIDIDDVGLTNRLRTLGCGLVISTAGPFQGEDYRVPQSAIAAGAHYIDIADARGFVCGITELNDRARDSGVLVVSGASSVPALSSAVVERYRGEFSLLREISFGISASEQIPGRSTVAAVLSYAGKRLRQWHNDEWRIVHGWQGLSAQDFGEPIGKRWLADCDIPDLELLPALYPELSSVRFQAGLGLKLLQVGTWLLTWLVRARLVANLGQWAPVLHSVARAFERFGDGRSGMFVDLKGQSADGRPRRVRWQLIAGQNHGPLIPCMAVVALTRKLASGTLVTRGATPCIGLITLDEYLAELTGLDIHVSAPLSG
jgi:hypothetical protein